MKKYNFYFLLFSLLFISACRDTKLNDIDLDFDTTMSPIKTTTYTGKPITLKVQVNQRDIANTYPYTVKIKAESGSIRVDEKEYKAGTPFEYDFRTKKELTFSFTPNEIKNVSVEVLIENELVSKSVFCDITCNQAYYDVSLEGLPERPLIDTKFDFGLILSEMESSGEEEVQAYAKILKGKGTIYNGEYVLNIFDEDAESKSVKDSVYTKAGNDKHLNIGRNNMSYVSTKEGENIIRFYLVNKWGHELTKDVAINVNLPEWGLDNSMGEDFINVPFQNNYSFNLSVNEADIFKDNEYTGFYRVLSNSELTLSINDKSYNQGASFPLKAGGNVGLLKVNDATQGEIEFIIKDKYKQEHKDTIRFISKLPVKPIVASLDKSSQSVKINQAATFKLTLSEQNYNDVFDVECQIINGAGTFAGGNKLSLSEGTHEIKFIPTVVGATTVKVIITDKNEQEKILNATVQASLSPLVVNLSSTSITLEQGQKEEVTLSTNEDDYKGQFTVKYECSGVDEVFELNNSTLGAGGIAYITGNTNKISITGIKIGTAKYKIKIEDEYKQKKELSLTCIVKGKVSVSAGMGGTVTGGGIYALNENATVKASAQDGYAFLGWYKNGQQVSTSATYTFSVLETVALEARFSKNSYTVAVSAEKGISVNGGGNFEHGASITVKASAQNGYAFSGWYEGATQVSTSAEYTFTVTKSRTLLAKAKASEYNVTVNAGTGGSVTGGGKFKYDTEATVTATINNGYAFDGWYEGTTKVSDALSYTFKVTGDRNLEAKFTANKYNIVVNAQPGGTVTGSGSYDYGKTVTIKATPQTNYTFDGWYEGTTKISSNAEYTFTVNKTVTLEAKFTGNKFSVAVNASAGGTATGSGSYEYNSKATVKATPQANYTFDGWYDGTTKVSTSAEYTFTVNKAVTLEAKFTGNKLNVTVNAETGGTATGSGSYEYGKNVVVTATVNNGYTFDGWYNGTTRVSASLSYTFVLQNAVTLTAKFTAKEFTIVVNAQPGGTVTGGGKYKFDSNTTVTATVNTGYSFAGWYEGTTKVSDALSYTFRVSGDKSLEARFAANKYNIVVNAQPGGTVTGSGSYDYGKTVTIKATPQTNYTFDGWYEGTTKISSNAEYTFTVNKTVTLEAKFTGNKFSVAVNASAGGTATGSGSYEYNSKATVKATPQANYTFDGWYDGTTKVSTSAEYTFTVNKAVTLEAKFTGNKLNVTVNAETGGTATGSGSYEYGKNVVVTATVNNGYTFDGWYNGTTRVSASLSYTFVLQNAVTLTAKFTAKEFTIVVNAQPGGTVTGGGKYKFDSNTTVTATVNTGYSFAGWYENNTKASEAPEYTFKVTGDRTLEARFTANKLNIIANAQTGGTVTGSGSYNFGTNVTVKATPLTNYIFDGWYENNTKVSPNLEYTFTANKSRTLEARFIMNKLNLTINVQTGGTVTGSGSYDYGTNATVKAIPNEGYAFDGWYEGNNLLSKSNPYILRIEKDKILEARFIIRKYNVATNLTEGGTVTGSGSYNFGTNATIKATPKEGYTFDGWYEGNLRISEALAYTFKVTGDKTLEARFSRHRFNYNVSTNIDDTYFVKHTGSGSDLQGNVINLSVSLVNVPEKYKDVYVFDGWYEGNNKISSSENTTYKLPSKDCNFIAKYRSTSYIVDCEAISDVVEVKSCSNMRRVKIYKDPKVFFTYKEGYLKYDTSPSVRQKIYIAYRSIKAPYDINIKANFTYHNNCDALITNGQKSTQNFVIPKGQKVSNVVKFNTASSLILLMDDNPNMTLGGQVIEFFPLSGDGVQRSVLQEKK